MFVYVVRQLIFNVNREVYVYELFFCVGEDNCFFDIFFDEVILKIFIFIYLSLGIEEIIGDKKVFINFYCDIFMFCFLIFLDVSKVVIEIVEIVDVDDVLVVVCKYI